jgi:hypothetical protein
VILERERAGALELMMIRHGQGCGGVREREFGPYGIMSAASPIKISPLLNFYCNLGIVIDEREGGGWKKKK